MHLVKDHRAGVQALGAGGVGLNAIQGCRVSGADKIIAIDVNPQRLEFAKRFGATHTILADRNDTGLLNAAREVKTLCGGRGADFAFECTAVPALGAAPLAMVRNAGTACQVSGIEQEIAIDMLRRRPERTSESRKRGCTAHTSAVG